MVILPPKAHVIRPYERGSRRSFRKSEKCHVRSCEVRYGAGRELEIPRRARAFVQGLIYHVYNQVGRGEAPFRLDEEADALFGLMQDIKRRDGLTDFAWCIMPNH